jgi:hypothetical protein
MSATMNRLPEDAASAAGARPSPRRLLIIVAVVMAVGGLLMATAWLLFMRAEPQTMPVVPAAEPTDPPAAAVEPELPVATALATMVTDASRDPFSPVIPDPVQVAETTDPAAPDAPTGEVVEGQQPPPEDEGEAPVVVESPLPEPVPVGCTVGDEVVCDGQVVRLLQVLDRADGTRVAIVQVGTSIYEVAPGTVVVAPVRLVSIEGVCVRLQHGTAQPFELCSVTESLK